MAKATYQGAEVRGLRTKEALIAAQQAARAGALSGEAAVLGRAAARMLKDQHVEGVVDVLPTGAARLWMGEALAGFDLKLVDEQGCLLADGWLALPAGPDARRCDHTDGDARCPDTATHLPEKWEGPRPRWCAKHAPQDASVDFVGCLAWKAGSHLDDVLALGAATVAAKARAALEKPAPLPENLTLAVSTLKKGELLVVEARGRKMSGEEHDLLCRNLAAALRPMEAQAIVLNEPVHRKTVEQLRDMLRGVGFDVVPALRREDLHAWLRSIGFEDTDRPGVVRRLRGDVDIAIDWLGTEQMPGLALDEGMVAAVASSLGMLARDVREAVLRHARAHAACFGTVADMERTGAVRRPETPLDGITCRCSRAVPKAEAFASNDGWRCAVCAADEAHKALQSIAQALDLPAGGDVTKVVPAAVGRLTAAHRAGDYHKVLVLEAAPEHTAGALVVQFPSGRRVTLEHGKRLLVEQVTRRAVERGATREEVASEVAAIVDEVAPFSREDYEAALKRAQLSRRWPRWMQARMDYEAAAERPYGPGQAGLLEHQLAEDRRLLGCAFVEQTTEGPRRVDPKVARRRTDGTCYRTDTGAALEDASVGPEERAFIFETMRKAGIMTADEARTAMGSTGENSPVLFEDADGGAADLKRLWAFAPCEAFAIERAAKKRGITPRSVTAAMVAEDGPLSDHERAIAKDEGLRGDPATKSASATFADLLAAGAFVAGMRGVAPVRVFVLEETYGARRVLLDRLLALGGAQGGAERTVVTFQGGIEVTLFHESHEACWLRCDVAVGFPAASAARLLYGSPVELAVAADDAARFWGMA